MGLLVNLTSASLMVSPPMLLISYPLPQELLANNFILN